MVGTTRFELATSPTPRVRSTRLSHVPTMVCTSAQAGDGGVYCSPKCTRPAPSAASGQQAQIIASNSHDKALVSRRDILLRQRTTFAKEKPIHLLDQKLLRLARPRLQTVLIQQHLLPLHPLAPRFF